MNRLLLFFLLTMTNFIVTAQDTMKTEKALTIDLFLDIYYSYDFNKPTDHRKPLFLYNYNRHNEVNINLALAKISYNKDIVRANMGIMAGTYPQYNLATEPELLRMVYEANAGVKILANQNLWVDAGIMPSHIGYESVIAKDNWTLTRSMAAENSPYYEAGAKITYISQNEKLLISGLILNGWQHIRRPNGNNSPAFGTQVTFKPSENTTINWSTFLGNDKPDSTKQWRYFNNFYGIVRLSKKVLITAGLDIGWEQRTTSDSYNIWYTPALVLLYKHTGNWAFAARGEYYNDSYGVIIPATNSNGFRVWGVSLNIDKRIFDDFYWRTEMRMLMSKDVIFEKAGSMTTTHTALTTSLNLSF